MAVVTEEMLEELRALCVGDMEKFKAISAVMDPEVTRTVDAQFLGTAFLIAVHRRFDGSSDFEIMTFVAEKRAVSERIADSIEPEVAEAVIRRVVMKEPIDLDRSTRYRAQIIVLIWVLADLRLRGEEMERFIAQARRVTDKHFAKLAEQEGSG